MATIKAVRAFGQDIRCSADSGAVIGIEGVLSTTYESGFVGGVAVELSDGRTVMIGERDGYGPTKVWLEDQNGEPVKGGQMSWSDQFEFVVD